ncbi:mechanosensitive ion channel family protein [Lagierella massiliensis]|uniref:mechanosensitive ion channel family protein n=1 Tax=Lagierella massiliensis TaxID=1689303 RepID=UPI0006D80D9F|nr:mechanosensitive ion channel family protein [Lagierella massiliensis]
MSHIRELYLQIKSFFYIDGTTNLNIFGKLAVSLLIFLITIFLAKVVTKFVFEKFLMVKTKKFKNVIGETTQGKTIASVMENTLRYIIYFFGILQILEVFKVGRSLTVGVAGIGGAAIGFGSQFIVRDFISGLFSLVEDQYGIGDNVLINGTISGIVEQFGMRTTKIRGFDGSITNISNGSIQTVKNMSRSNQRAFVEMTIPTGVSVEEATSAVEKLGEELSENKNVTVKPYIYGITGIGNFDNVKITVVGWTNPGEQYWLELQIRKRFLEICEEYKVSNTEGDTYEI